MEEKILTTKKNGMAVMLLTILLLIVGIAGIIFSGIHLDSGDSSAVYIITLIVSLLIVCLGWIPLCGLRILKPQEALVLTLFGKYIGTIKEDGFYFVNPFA
ncbi:MAG: SPFH domain-containing protein, partial [Clostridia bacterium]|nr:SPFH domain-containing protein [Clostridia bacterium]